MFLIQSLRVKTFFVLLLLCVHIRPGLTLSAEIDFQRDVLPILTQHCIDCHGPDAAEADLRLDNLLLALKGGDSGESTVVPGESTRSYLITRIQHENASKRMPPDSPALGERDISILKAWIDDAALWKDAEAELAKRRPEHWSFAPVARPDVPLIKVDSNNPIDAFVLERLQKVDLSHSPPAEKQKLIRRLFLVLHGLPPSPDQVDQFLNDNHDNAWELLVDRVLASEHYGVRLATLWLDLVRFGETTGFETNRERPNAWHYRDWVVNSFNADKPYDQFVMEQIAGDALGATEATGFLVAGPNDIVKGQNALLRLTQRQDELADIINTTGTAFLGLSLGCARCHNHKFDPVSQSDFYSLQAVFAGVNHNDRAMPIDNLTREQIAALDNQIVGLQKQIERFVSQSRSSVGADRDGNGKMVRHREPVKSDFNRESFAPTPVRFVRFTILDTNQGQPCIDELEIFVGDQNVALASAGAVASSSGDFVHALHKLEHVNDGQVGNDRSWISSMSTGGWVQIELPETQSIDSIQWGRDRNGIFGDRLATEYRIEGSIDDETWSLLASSDDRLPFDSSKPVTPNYDFSSLPADQAKLGNELVDQLNWLTAKRETLAKPTMIYAGTFAQPGPTHRLYRGEPTALREQVVPAAIKSLTDLVLTADAPEQERRLAIARWIADANNPLTARVMVNRIWQFHFGTGIVDTPSDFGGNGTPPSHPQLLDWLAAELIESGWSLKHIHRLILTSKTWQQDSRPLQQGVELDAATRLLWRFPPRRLEAEGIRDSILSVTGKLDPRIGGPGFSGFEIQPENVRHYFPKSSFGPEDWRRMLYMTKVRQERDAVFGVFDCPDFSQVVPKRTQSTTPLQALNLLNSQFVLQQAEFLIDRLDSEADTPEDKVKLAFNLCFGRNPELDEVTAALAFVDATNWHALGRVLLNANEFVLIP